MRLFSCPHCAHRLYFENAQCLNCGSTVAYEPHQVRFVLAGLDGNAPCVNSTECACNWVAESGPGSFCLACSLNKTIPDLSIDGNREKWTRVEAAKRRMIFSLLSFNLPVAPKTGPDDPNGIAFDFLADMPSSGPGGEHILTGHDNGLITLNVAEADSAEREKMRAAMGEAYRTLLGHFRHEIGHYYWDRLIRDDPTWLQRFRALFGDESVDYATALEAHYQNGAPSDWSAHHISAYAASHPWEDWAETWAHYLHIADTLEMAETYRIPLDRINSAAQDAPPEVQAKPEPDAFDLLLARWLALSEAANSINRCMGLPDLYPFVISPPVAEKLRFVDNLLGERQGASAPFPR